MLTNLLDGLNSFGAAILETVGVDKDDAQRLITKVSQQYKESTHWRMSMNMYPPAPLSLVKLVFLVSSCILGLQVICFPFGAVILVFLICSRGYFRTVLFIILLAMRFSLLKWY